MHICYITNEFPKPGFSHGGVGTFIATIGKALVLKGVQISVVGMNYEDKDETEFIDGIHVRRLSRLRISGLDWYFNSKAINRAIREIHKERVIDVIETAELGLAFINKLQGIKYVIRMHGGHHFFTKAENRKTQWRDVWQEKKSFAKADSVLAVSKYVKNITRELLGLGDIPIKVIYNPVDTDKFKYEGKLENKPYSIFFAGSIVEKKGIRQLVQALNYIIKDFPKTHLYIAGRDAFVPGTQTPYRPILESAITKEIKNHVTFLGVIPNIEMPKYITEATLCCYPSHMEAMPLAWLEVLAAGQTFVGSTTGPGQEAVSHLETGLLADPHNPKDIAEKIKWVFEHTEEAHALGLAARQDVLNRFSIQTIAEENLNFYQDLMNK